MTSEEIIQKLSEKGFRLSRVRCALIHLLAKHAAPMSVPEILNVLKKDGCPANKTSVYRELANLEREQIVTPIIFDDTVSRYEIAEQKHHHHAVCLSCRAVLEIPVENDTHEAEERIAEKAQFHILRHEVEFFGRCAGCQQKQDA